MSLFAAGCFVDSVGVPPPIGGSPSDGGGGSSSNFTGGSTTAGAPAGGEGTVPSGGEGGGPSPTNCGDGTVVTGEQCEDGNVVAGDGCDASCQLEHTCGNAVIEPTEECDPTSPSCSSDCKAAPSTGCADAVAHQDADTNETVEGTAPDNPFLIPTAIGEWADTVGYCDAVNDAMIPTNVYRIQIGPYPEGVFIKVHKKGNLDPVLALYKGCGDVPEAGLFCHHANDAFVVSDVVPAGSVMFATVGDRGDGDDFDMFMWFHRFWTTFDSLSGFTIDASSWIQGVDEIVISGLTDADGGAVITPPIFVGNLPTFEVVARYGYDDSDLNVAVSFDDGVTWEQERGLPAASVGGPKWAQEEFENSADALHARVRITFVNPDINGAARLLALRLQPVAPFNTW